MAKTKQIQADNDRQARINAMLDDILARAREQVLAEVEEKPSKRKNARKRKARAKSATTEKQEQFREFLVARAKRKASNKALAARIRAKEFASKREALKAVRAHAKPATLPSWEAMVASVYA